MTTAKARMPSLSALSAIGGAALQGAKDSGPTLLPLDKIEEDASQPRTHFDPKELDELAASIRAHGVLQPIGVVKGDADTYRIVFGARRWRAARIAALQVIPAIILSASQATLDVQIIENVHRSDLRGSELVAGIARMAKEGKSRKEIAELLGWDADRVKRFQALDGAPGFIMEVLDGGTTMRAAYDLFYAWKKAPAAIEAAVGSATEFSYDQVRGIIAAALEKPVVGAKKEASEAEAEAGGEPPTKQAAASEPEITSPALAGIEAERAEDTASIEPEPEPESGAGGMQEDVDRGRPAPVQPDGTADGGAKPTAPRPAAAPVRRAPRFTVAAGDREGVLITSRASDRDDHALVEFDGVTEDVPLDGLRLIAVAVHP